MTNNKKQTLCRFLQTLFSSKWFSFPYVYKIRTKIYQKMFDLGESPILENDVWIYNMHGTRGSLKIGNKVLLARDVSIDYTGHVIIEDNVWLSEGACNHSHSHSIDTTRLGRGKDTIVKNNIILRNGCWIGSRAIILPQVEEIGEGAIIAAGSVVTKKVEPFNVFLLLQIKLKFFVFLYLAVNWFFKTLSYTYIKEEIYPMIEKNSIKRK